MTSNNRRPIPAYIAETITINTGVNPAGIVTRGCRYQPCPTCKRRTLRGLDADICATDVTVDPVCLTELGEAVAQMAAIPTFERHSTGGRTVLDRRTFWRIAARPAGRSDRQDVHPLHDCTRTWNDPATYGPTALNTSTRSAPVDPPY